ncbi:MAG: TlpA disulfide reductase family protein [Burkholderiaceae bacterium]|nr:TlpA family protein disulfide reductase [Rhodoferax sp.]MCB2003623.1 TlpA family protein disulfide reductase [Rhodoferax sp.]MCB2040456.1 TlpA family protein disulfide reductase [Rhodoferax sp.]MCP5260817.1 TlpA family protein disulfide reductase [Rhodoferax sp.]
MNNALTLGPLLLPYALLLVFAAAGITMLVGRHVGKRTGVDVEGTLWNAMLVGAVVARLAFVLEYKTLYFSSPLSIVDIRDGGWNATAGLAGMWFYAFHRFQKHPATRKALQRALLAGTAVFALGIGWLAIQSGPGQQTLPDLELAALEAAAPTVRLAQFTGKPVVVNLWATWCPPCVREMPMFVDAQRRHADIHFVFINQGEERAQVARWLHARQLQLANMLIDDKRQASAAFKQQGYPTTLFFNARGEMVASRLGELSAATLEQNLQKAR